MLSLVARLCELLLLARCCLIIYVCISGANSSPYVCSRAAAEVRVQQLEQQLATQAGALASAREAAESARPDSEGLSARGAAAEAAAAEVAHPLSASSESV